MLRSGVFGNLSSEDIGPEPGQNHGIGTVNGDSDQRIAHLSSFRLNTSTMDGAGPAGYPPHDCTLRRRRAAPAGDGSTGGRPARMPAAKRQPLSTNSTATGRLQLPVAECSRPSSSGPALATR